MAVNTGFGYTVICLVETQPEFAVNVTVAAVEVVTFAPVTKPFDAIVATLPSDGEIDHTPE